MFAGRIQTAIRAGVRMAYPPQCLGCGGRVDSAFGLCGPCFAETHFIGGALCDACGTPLPGDEGPERLACDACLASPRPWSRGRAALLYGGTGRRLVLALKHGDRAEVARAAAPWLARAAAPLLAPGTLVVPVPLHLLRLLRRRSNQSALLAAALGRATGHEVIHDALRRRAATPSLDGRSRAERFAALDGALAVRPARAERLEGARVLVVDDVMTSGATFAAATEALLAVGAGEVCVLALARVARDA